MMNFTKRSRRIKKEPSPVQLLLIFYFLAIIGSTAILSLPVAYKPGVSIPFIDVLFTAVSALSVTGLSTVDLSETFSTTGIVMIALIIQLGAVGVMAIGTFLWLLLGKEIGIKERQLIKTDQNQPTFSGMVRLIKLNILLLLTIEIIAMLLLGAYIIKHFPTVKEAYFQSFFMVQSAVSNGGFDITGESLLFFQTDYFVLWINMTLIVIGAIGFPVLIEIKDYLLLPRKKRQLFRFSL